MPSHRCQLHALLLAVLFACALAQDATVQGTIQQLKTAQQEVLKSWRFRPEMVCAAASVHGRIEKRALGSAISGQLQPTAAALQAYIKAGVPIYCGMQVFISDRFRFIFIRQPKASSTSILDAIQRLYCQHEVCSRDQFRRIEGPIDDAKWRDYFVFTAVRNPIARMISTYNMFHFANFLKVRDPADSSKVGPPCGITFTEFCRDVWTLRRICEQRQCCAYLAAGWQRHVPHFVNPHITQQAHAIFTLSGESVVDYIARTEHITEDWAEIVKLIAARSGKDLGPGPPIVNVNGHKRADVAVANPYSCLAADSHAALFLNESTVNYIAMQFALDIQAFGFLEG